MSDHVSECSECRGALARTHPADRVAAEMARFLDDESDGLIHLTPEQLVDSVGSTLSAAEDQVVRRHLEVCADCRAELADLTGFASTLAPRRWRQEPWLRGAIAASLATAVIATWWGLRASRPVIAPPPPGRERMEQVRPNPPRPVLLRDGALEIDDAGIVHGVADVWRPRVEAALQRSELKLPEAALALVRPPERQRAESGPQPLVRLEAPRSSVVLDDRPTFRWRGPANGTYRVEVYGPDFELLASSGTLRRESWRPAVPLPRGRALTWKIAGTEEGVETSYPAPPEPPAVFEIAAGAAAREVETARATGSRLLTGLALWQAGAIEEAAKELAVLARENPQSPFAQRLAASSARVVRGSHAGARGAPEDPR